VYNQGPKAVEDPDEIVKCKVDFCEHFKCNLSEVDIKEIDRRQITDFPPVKAITIEYQGEIKECPNCHKITKATFPKVRGQTPNLQNLRGKHHCL